MKFLGKFSGGLCLGLFLLMPQAKAEVDASSRAFVLEPIRVTAQKVEQDLQRVPGSVSVASGTDLEEQKITHVYDFLDHVPNVSVQKNSTDNYIGIRGIMPFSGSFFSPVGVYVDGINYPIHVMQPIELMDIKRIEVLKGPQGTLYGRNTESGVINIITNTPSNKFEGKVFSDIGVWHSTGKPIFEQGVVANFPLVQDKLATRISLQHKYSDGFMRNLANSQAPARQNNFIGRAVTAWTPHEDLNVSLTLESHNKNDGIGLYRFTGGPGKTKKNSLAWNQKNHNIVDADVQALKIHYAMPDFDIFSTTGRHHFQQNWQSDGDMGPLDIFGPQFAKDTGKNQMTILSEELRLSSRQEDDNKFDWLTGLYLYHEDIDVNRFGFIQQRTDQTNKGVALFAQGTLHFLEKFHFTLGGRVEHSDLEATKHLRFLDRHISKRLQFTEFLPSAALSYDITPDVMTFAKVSKGFLSGGFDYYRAADKNNFSYDPEYSWNYELGLKSKWLEDRLRFNLTGFYIDIKDKQVVENVTIFERSIDNAGKARSYGAEMDTQFLILPELALSASVGVLNSEIVRWKTTGPNPLDFAGKKVPVSPRMTYSFGARYQAQNGFFVGADVAGKSSHYADAENNLKISGHYLVNAQTGWIGENLEVSLWAKNLFNKNYAAHKFRWNHEVIQQGEPLSYGVRLTYNF